MENICKYFNIVEPTYVVGFLDLAESVYGGFRHINDSFELWNLEEVFSGYCYDLPLLLHVLKADMF